jgi:5-oxoprolinase (ATP-hydrolysing) subunit A
MDLNADLGEGFGQWELTDDEALLEIVTSANVACGFHAGDPLRLQRVLQRAAERGVAVGAHVSYRDLAGFGRRFIDATPDELRADVLFQVGGLRGVAVDPTQVRFVKPHGALYHACSTHPAQGSAVSEAAGELPVLAAAGSAFLTTLGDRGVAEGFVDRAYNDDGTLVSRREPGAVLEDPARVVDQAVQLAVDDSVTTITGQRLDLHVRSLCVHGDTPGAAVLAQRVRDALVDAGVTLAPFA